MLSFVIALAVVVAVGLWLGRGRGAAGPGGAGRPAKRACSWSETGARNGRFVEYKCAACGVAAYSATGQAPVICKRTLGGAG